MESILLFYQNWWVAVFKSTLEELSRESANQFDNRFDNMSQENHLFKWIKNMRFDTHMSLL